MIKKVLIIILVLLSTWVEAQSTYKGISLTYGTRPTISDNFKWDEEDAGLSIPIHIDDDNTVTIYSQITQKYIAISSGETLDEYSTMWKTIDVDGNRCNIYITNMNNSVYLFVEYKNYGWFYELAEY